MLLIGLRLLETIFRDFPGGPVVKTPCCVNAGSLGSILGQGTKIPLDPWCDQKI